MSRCFPFEALPQISCVARPSRKGAISFRAMRLRLAARRLRFARKSKKFATIRFLYHGFRLSYEEPQTRASVSQEVTPK